MTRRLAAILAADVVGYSSKMEADEDRTFDAVRTLFDSTVEPSVARHGGRIVKRMGDGLLAEFASVVDALVCAVSIQTLAKERIDRAAETQNIQMRIGINLGDLIVRDDDIFGDGVNVAARLEGLARPGGICVSAIVAELVGQKLDTEFDDLGEIRLKNISRPIRAYHVAGLGDDSASPPMAAKPPSPELPAIAILPFANQSSDPEQEYFSDGVTDDIITALAYVKQFPVIARNSSFSYKGRTIKTREVARELGARFLLEGGVRRAGDRIRITARLIDAETDHPVWADRYDRLIGDIFELQDEITGRIVASIAPELTQAQSSSLKDRRPDKLSAWELFLLGSSHLYSQTHDGNLLAREAFKQAIDLDPGYGEAWSGFGHSFLRELGFESREDRGSLIDKGHEAAKRGLALAPSSAYALLVSSTADIWRGELEKGIDNIRRALLVNPYDAHAQMALGNRLDLIGKAEEGIAQMERSVELNPRDPYRGMYFAYLSRAHLTNGDPAVALEWIDNAVALKRGNPDFHFRRAVCLASIDLVEEARAALRECEKLESGFVHRRAISWRPYSDSERNERFFSGLYRHNLLDFVEW
ncbi:MAG: adenylate/guanylate cyclase domain-containing protein [Azospirillaceae bacterium]